MAQLINFLFYPPLAETFYLFKDLTCFLLVSSRSNVFPVSQVLVISAAQPLTTSKSQSLQKEWFPRLTPRAKWPLVKDSVSVLCPGAITPLLKIIWTTPRSSPGQCLSQSPTLPESACWLSQEDAAYIHAKIIKTFSNLTSRYLI